jgi:hypothetical protein
MSTIINKVAQSGLVTIDLEDYYINGERASIDIKNQLWQGIALKEKDFREFISTHNWQQYENKFVAVFCSADAIIPAWAYMLISIALQPYAKKIVCGSPDELESVVFTESLIKNINPKDYENSKVIIKGCSKVKVPLSAYVEITKLLTPFAKSIMYGEPCSTVPVYKKKP